MCKWILFTSEKNRVFVLITELLCNVLVEFVANPLGFFPKRKTG